MPDGEVIDLTDLPDDPPAPAGLDLQQRAMAQQLMNVYSRQSLHDALTRLLQSQNPAIELAVYQALLASGGPAAVQGPPLNAYVAAPGILYPPHAAYAVNPHYRIGPLPPVYPAQPVAPAHDYTSEEDEDADERQYEICERCSEEFDPEDDDDSCRYHSGSLEIDYDADGWADWDEYVHGPMDTDAHQQEWPENFTWTCCGKAGDDKSGCEEGAHSVP